MEQVWGLVALIGAAQILNSVKQLKNSRREMFNGGGTYTLFLFSNFCLIYYQYSTVIFNIIK